MPNYQFPTISEKPTLEPKTAWLVASGDLRQAPNTAGWPTQQKLEDALTSALADLGWSVHRAHAYDPIKKHGFIDSPGTSGCALGGGRNGLAIQPPRPGWSTLP
jgi:hypothetical protein